ncbi:hypothetical protein [Paenibacillus lutrae]|uniref:Uncharacterized protein n=1 Tax=Paenibacillus lutrae TaxID=2078573 RepID=A0A7X3FLU7_9BACL|nr:hypothetical protein [Paenibacillus lutrae]MVP02007.1 hypothetical protein [Paenibacillus lutrae]
MREQTPRRPNQPPRHVLPGNDELPSSLMEELNRQRPLHPSDDFTERVMDQILSKDRELSTVASREWKHKQRRSRLIHLFVATAATYMFINSGLVKLLNSHMLEWSDFIHQVSNRIT